jgi:hypothetical protein
MDSEVIEATRAASRAFERSSVRYYLCGSMASSVRGIARATMDVDFVAALRESQIVGLVAELEKHFDVDAEMIADAVRARRSFNIVHSQYFVKVDVFVAKETPYDMEAFRHATAVPMGSHSVIVASAEDTVLAKLVWYRLGNEVSDRQWSDILGVLRLQRENMDRTYLDRWAEPLGVRDLLLRAQEQSR